MIASRHMPPKLSVVKNYPIGADRLAAIFGVLMGTGVLWFMAQSQETFIVGAIFASFFFINSVLSKRHTQRMIAEREHLTICDFARSFDRKTLDPWAVRFVWEGLTDLTGYPVKSTDHLWRELCIDDDDIDLDWPDEVVRRLGRSFEDAPNDAAPVNTVEDLVNYISALPVRQLPV